MSFCTRLFRLVLTAVAVGIVASAVSAQSPVIVLRAARLFDGRQMQTPGVVVVRGTVITAVGPSATIPCGAPVVDVGDATLSPGFIDAHTHLSANRRVASTPVSASCSAGRSRATSRIRTASS